MTPTRDMLAVLGGVRLRGDDEVARWACVRAGLMTRHGKTTEAGRAALKRDGDRPCR